MSKESALSMLSGTPVQAVNPSLVTGQTHVVDNSVEVVETAPGIDSDRFARIAAKEERLQKERETFKSEQQKLYEEKKQLQEIKTKIDSFEALKAKDPVAALKEIGFTENDIFNFMASKENEELTPEQKAAQAAQGEIKKWEDAQAQKAAEDMAKRDAKAIAAFRSEIGTTVSKEADKYEYCNHYGEIANDIIYETVLNIIKEENDILPHVAMKEAMDLVENFYEKEDEAMSSLKKRKPKAESATPTPEPASMARKTVITPPKDLKKPVPTITNKTTATVAGTKSPNESAEQKRSRLESWLRTGVKPS